LVDLVEVEFFAWGPIKIAKEKIGGVDSMGLYSLDAVNEVADVFGGILYVLKIVDLVLRMR